jgi:hypothetical protein
MDHLNDFTPDTPSMLEREAKDVSKILDAIQDYVYKVGEHLSKVAIGVECTGDEDAKAASCNAITCRKLLPLFRSVNSAKGFNVAGQHFQNILGSLSLLPEQIEKHLKYCTLINSNSYREMLSVFKYNINRMKEISQTPAMYKEPYFLPAYSSTPNSNMSAREQRSPITPMSKYGQNRSIPARTNLFDDSYDQETQDYLPSESRSNLKKPAHAFKSRLTHKDNIKQSINSTSTEAELDKLVTKIIGNLEKKKLSCPICQCEFARRFTLTRHIK